MRKHPVLKTIRASDYQSVTEYLMVVTSHCQQMIGRPPTRFYLTLEQWARLSIEFGRPGFPVVAFNGVDIWLRDGVEELHR
jgi:hypothetical protein